MTNAPHYEALFDGKKFFPIKIWQKNIFPMILHFLWNFFFQANPTNFFTKCFPKNLQRAPILLFKMKLTWHDTMWCLSILYTYSCPTIFVLFYYSPTRWTFSKNLQRDPILLFKTELTWHGTMWCLSILYTFTYPRIFNCSIILPPGGLLVKIFKEVSYSYLKCNWHDMVPCGAYQYCTHLPTQEFSIALLFFHQGDF